jgi:hypothetical protein
LEVSAAIREKITKQIEGREESFGRITACRVTVRAAAHIAKLAPNIELKFLLAFLTNAK